MNNAARIGDQQVCSAVSGGTAHSGGIISKTTPPHNVYIEGKIAAIVGDQSICAAGGPNLIPASSGSTTVKIGGQNAIRIGDRLSHPISMVSTGATKTFIGG